MRNSDLLTNRGNKYKIEIMKGKRIGLSAHSLNIFIECPRCFYLYVKEGIKRPRGPMPSIATGIDSLIKDYFEYFRKKGQLPPFLKKEVEGKLISNLEKTYYYDIEGIEKYYLFGHIDEIIQLPDGLYIPLDHKTKGSSPGEPHSSYQFQIGIYSLLLKRENKGKEVNFGYLVYYYPEKKLIDYQAEEIRNIINFNFEVKRVEINPEEIKEIVKRGIECLENDKIPDPGEKCEYCEWINNTKIYYIESKFEIKKEIVSDTDSICKVEREEEIEFPDGHLFR